MYSTIKREIDFYLSLLGIIASLPLFVLRFYNLMDAKYLKK